MPYRYPPEIRRRVLDLLNRTDAPIFVKLSFGGW